MDYASTDVLTDFREKSYGFMCTKPAVTPVSLQDTISKQCPNGGGVRRSCVAIMVQKMAFVAQMQEFLSGNNTFFYGKSTGNQRIEMFWNFLRKECVQYWIDSQGTLRDTGLFTGDFIYVNLIQFCCMKLLKITLVNIILNS